MNAFVVKQELAYFLYCSTHYGLAVKIFHVFPEKQSELLDVDNNINPFIQKTKVMNELVVRFPKFFEKFLEYLMWVHSDKKKKNRRKRMR